MADPIQDGERVARFDEAALEAIGRTHLERETMESVNHPSHYGGADNPYEVIKVIEAWGFDVKSFCLGNTLKYVGRSGKKPGVSEREDLLKAQWYLNYAIEKLND
jgi:hypothetical protein